MLALARRKTQDAVDGDDVGQRLRTVPVRPVGQPTEIVEAHHVTGEDCFVPKVMARSMRHLGEVTGRLASLGPVTRC